MRRIILLIVPLATGVPATAAAQPPNPPRVELGAQASIQTGQEGKFAWAPRVTLNLTPSSALEAGADLRRPTMTPWGSRISGRAFSVHWRQTLFMSGRWQVFGVLGAGSGRTTQHYAERVIDGRDGPEVLPAVTYTDSGPSAHLGPGVQIEVAPWLALRGDVRLTVGHDSGVRALAGVVVPVRRFRAGQRPTGPTPPLAAWARVKAGREVWVTTTAGRLVHGELAAISDTSLRILRQGDEVTVPLADVRIVEGRDSLKNGIVIGGITGAAGGAALFGWAVWTFCESDSCGPAAGWAAVLGAASGAVVGGLTGAMVDGLIPGRQSLFERTGMRVVPVITPGTKAVTITRAWR